MSLFEYRIGRILEGEEAAVTDARISQIDGEVVGPIAMRGLYEEGGKWYTGEEMDFQKAEARVVAALTEQPSTD